MGFSKRTTHSLEVDSENSGHMNFKLCFGAAEDLSSKFSLEPSANEISIEVASTLVSKRKIPASTILKSVCNADGLTSSSPVRSVCFIVETYPLKSVVQYR